MNKTTKDLMVQNKHTYEYISFIIVWYILVSGIFACIPLKLSKRTSFQL